MKSRSSWLALLTLAVVFWAGAAQAQPPCPPGTHWNPHTQRCEGPRPACPPGSHWSVRLQRCVSKNCPPGTVWVHGHGCRPVGPPPPAVAPPPPGPAVPPAPAPQRWAPPAGVPSPGSMMVVRASSLNLRECPGKRCRVLTVLNPGEPVAFHEYRHGFALVRVPGRGGMEGWVDYRYLGLP